MSIYSLMSFTVSRRPREIAIRSALGARRGQIVRIVFGKGFVQLLIGVALGGLVAVPVLWDGVVDEGPRSLVIVAILLLGAGTAACLIPVRRALRVEPAAAMKSERRRPRARFLSGSRESGCLQVRSELQTFDDFQDLVHLIVRAILESRIRYTV